VAKAQIRMSPLRNHIVFDLQTIITHWSIFNRQQVIIILTMKKKRIAIEVTVRLNKLDTNC